MRPRLRFFLVLLLAAPVVAGPAALAVSPGAPAGDPGQAGAPQNGAAAQPQQTGALLIKKVDQSDFPKVKIHLGVAGYGGPAGFHVYERGLDIPGASIESIKAEGAVVAALVVDVSGSMAGRPLELAKEAARRFVARAAPSDKTSVIAFAGGVRQLTPFTEDKAQLDRAISRLDAPRGGSAIYDALQTALKAAGKERNGNRVIVLLTDGADKKSHYKPQDVVGLLGKDRVPIYAVVLKSPDFNPGPLEGIASRSGGSMLVAGDPQSLVGLYESLAAGLHQEYVVSYLSRSDERPLKVEVETAIDGNTVRASTMLPQLPGGAGEDLGKSLPEEAVPLTFPGGALVFWLVVMLGFASVVMIILAVGGFLGKDKNTLAEQLRYYDQLRGKIQARGGEGKEGVKQRAVDLVGSISTKMGFSDWAKLKLEQAGLPVKPYEFMLVHLIAMVVFAGLVNFLTDSILFSLLALAVAASLPLVILTLLVQQRTNKFDDQLPDTLNMLAGFMKAGYGLHQAVSTASHESPQPTAAELARVNNQVQYGTPLEEALEKMAVRIGSAPFRWVVVAILIHRETGGNLTGIFESMSESLRQRQSQQRQLKALTSEGRLSAWILIIMPFAQAGVLFALNPDYMSILYTSRPGMFMLAAALGLMMVGIAWIKKVITIDI